MADAVIDLTGEEEAPKAVVPSAKRQRQAPVQKKKKKKKRMGLDERRLAGPSRSEIS